MVKYLSMEEKPLSRELWEEAFPEDSREFVDYYYREKLKGNRVLAAWEDGKVQAMAHQNPYILRVGSCRWRVDYLVGVATRKEKRHQGYMRRLLVGMMADMRKEQMPFCFLMPADEAIYRPFGFTYIFRQPVWKLREDVDLTRWAVSLMGDAPGSQRYLEELACWMEQWMERRYRVHTVRDTEYLLGLLDEISSEDGALDALYSRDGMVGVQGVWGLKEREQRLLYCDAPYAVTAGEPKPAIMARIITPEHFVRAVRLGPGADGEEITLPLYLEDPLIAENRGAWLWHINRETSWLEKTEGSGTEDAREACGMAADAKIADGRAEGAKTEGGLCLTVEELTEWLFGYAVPEAAKPFEGQIETLGDIFLDEVV